MRRLLALLAGVGLACAQPSPPTGGPTDDSPPSVGGTSPALYAVDVPLDAPLRIAFSEPMNHGEAEDGVLVRPQVDWGRRMWVGDTLVAMPREGWAPNTTYTVLVRSSVTDRRGNRLPESALVVFGTGAHVARGRVSGMLSRIGVSEGDVVIVAFRGWSADTTAADPLEALAVTEPDAAGRFLLPGLEVGEPVEIGAVFDVNENDRFDPGTDLYCRALAPVTPAAGGGPDDVSIVLVFPDEPGRIEATVLDTTCARLEDARRRRAVLADSLFARRDSLLTARATLEARSDSLFGEALAPEGAGTNPDSLRAAATALRSEAAAIDVPDSAAIAVLRLHTEAETADSVYCGADIVARFASERDTTRVSDRGQGTPLSVLIADVPPGPYLGRVWRDLNGDDAFDAGVEPGRDSLWVWVAPGQAGVVDTLTLGRREENP